MIHDVFEQKMCQFPDEEAAIRFVFRSLRRLRGIKRGEDSTDRDPRLGAQLLAAHRLIETAPISAVITGSKGKGSVAILATRILAALGYRVGMLTSPHLVSWFERIRVAGRAIPEADFYRILGDLAPTINTIEASLSPSQHLSPQAIFRAVALQHFRECDVQISILEVGRGGRFDDVALVPKQVAAFTPIFREHLSYLGRNLSRITWHKSGILSPGSFGISVPQRTVVRKGLELEASRVNAPLRFLHGRERGQHLGTDTNGTRLMLHPYGELRIGLAGLHQVENNALAMAISSQLAAAFHKQPAAPFSEAQMARIRPALAALSWPGRLQVLQDEPLVIMDGAIHGRSARALVASVKHLLRNPVVSILCVPQNKGYRGVYRALARVSDQLILTETTRNRILPFPTRESALKQASATGVNATHCINLEAALIESQRIAGKHGTILIVGTHSILADAALHWGLRYDSLW